ncbi:MAG TPA: PEP-CTERM sorting domain-containing protein [Chthoniobacteraceae bacterium]|nr:PEP-CTERM sorting domain-containing protein [Chthoniobacteraceae bacterium]
MTIKPFLLLAFAALAGHSTLHAAPLIEETWAGYNLGAAGSQFAAQGDIWSLESGAANYISIVNYADSDSGKGLQVFPNGGSWVRITTKNGYTASEGVRFDLQFRRLNDLQSFTRVRIQNAYSVSSPTGYFLNVTATALNLSSFYGANPSEAIASWEFKEGDFAADTTYRLSLEVIAKSGGNLVNVYFDDQRVISVTDSGTGRLNLAVDSLYFGFDSRHQETASARALYGNLTVTPVPEPSSALLGIAALGAVAAGLRWRRGRSR